MAAFVKLNAVIASVWNGGVNLGSDTVKAMLTNTQPSATAALYTDISGTEVANGNGYTTGGASLTLTSSAQTAGLYKYIASAANPTWTATGAVGPFRYAAIYDSTSGKLLGYWDYGQSVTLGNGDTFTLQLDATNGVIQSS